jgi:hypothetical protein
MSTQVDEIKDIIIHKLRESKEVAGSDLGYSITQKFPEINMKAKYGGLKRFITEYCFDEVIWLRKRGADDIYSRAINTSLKKIEPPEEFVQVAQDSLESFWRAFSNPNTVYTVVLNKITGELSLKKNDEPVREPFIRVEKVSREEYRQIAWDFLPQLDEAQRIEFRQSLSLDDFWPHWSALINKYKKEGVLDTWLQWRTERIRTIFENRLKLADVTSTVTEQAVNQLTQPPKKRPLSHQARATRDDIEKNIDEDQLRKIIHTAIDKLSLEELRRIWLPLGIITDILKSR